MVGFAEFEQFDGRAVFDYERDVRNLPDEIGDRRVGFETHPLHAKFTFLVARTTKSFRCFEWISPGFASVVGIPM
jgi:hypothetical protein